MRTRQIAAALLALVLGSSAAPPETPEAKPARPEYVFKAWSGDPKIPESLNFQFNPPRRGEPRLFLKLGDTVRGTTLKLLKFDQKDGKTEGHDVSELTLINTATGKRTVLVIK